MIHRQKYLCELSATHASSIAPSIKRRKKLYRIHPLGVKRKPTPTYTYLLLWHRINNLFFHHKAQNHSPIVCMMTTVEMVSKIYIELGLTALEFILMVTCMKYVIFEIQPGLLKDSNNFYARCWTISPNNPHSSHTIGETVVLVLTIQYN